MKSISNYILLIASFTVLKRQWEVNQKDTSRFIDDPLVVKHIERVIKQSLDYNDNKMIDDLRKELFKATDKKISLDYTPEQKNKIKPEFKLVPTEQKHLMRHKVL